MPNWKKVIVSGSDASLNSLYLDTNLTASIVSASQFTGSFYGDGSNLTGILVDDGLPNNGWDFNIDDTTPIDDFQTASLVYLIDFNNLPLVGTEAGKIGWIGNTTGATQVLPANDGLYILANDTLSAYITSQGYSGSIVGIGNVMDYSASVDARFTSIGGANGVISGSQQITDFGFLQTSSFNSFTSSYTTHSSSFDDRLDALETLNHSYSGSISGSLTGSAYLDYILFNTSSAATLQSYMLQANTTDKTLDLRMGNNATLQLGQELYHPPIVNKSGVDLNDGDLVMFNPAGIAQGNRISVVKAVADGTYPAERLVGVLTEDVANNQEGFATWFGYVRNISKTTLVPAGETWVEGDVLYANPTIAGKLTNVFPTAPNLRVTVATVTAINGNNVTIMVNFHRRTALKRAHDVLDNSTTSSYGDLLIKSGSIWTNSKQLSGSYAITGSLRTNGSEVISGSLTVTGSVAGNVVALSVSSGTASIDFRAGTFFTLTIPSSSITHITASNMQPGLTANLILTQQATTGSVRWDSGFKFPSGSFNTGSASGSAVDIVSMMMVNNTTIYSVGANRIQ